MKRFIVEPIAVSNLAFSNWVVVIDGLDAYDNLAGCFSKLVSSVMTEPDAVPRLEGKLKFLICSRSSSDISKELASCPAVAVRSIESSNLGFYINSSSRVYVCASFFF